MTLRPLRIAFTALTLSLTVSLSLWVLHATYEQRQFSNAVTLQMPSAPAEINSHEVRENLASARTAADPFAEADAQPQMVELKEPPELIGIEAAPVSRNSSKEQAPPPFPSGDEIEVLPEVFPRSPSQRPQSADEPLELPELNIDGPAEQGPAEFPQLDPAGPEPERTQPQPEPPLVELVPEPLVAPRPPAWLSAQATLEAEIKELRQQQQALEVALSNRLSADEEWKERERIWRQQQQAWSDEKQGFAEQLALAHKEAADTRKQLAEAERQMAATRQRLERATREATDLQRQLQQQQARLKAADTLNGELKDVNDELKDTLKEKLSIISKLENDARKAKYEIEQLRKTRRAGREVLREERLHEGASLPGTMPSDAPPADNPAPALLPPLPGGTDKIVGADLVPAEPIVPRLAGRTDPPAETEQLMLSQPNPPQTPLMPAEVPLIESGYCSRCGAVVEQPPEKTGLTYDLGDWFDEWNVGRNSSRVLRPIRKGERTGTGGGSDEKVGLIPDLVRWWKQRRDR